MCRALQTKWFWNHCSINMSNLIRFLHIYTPLELDFQFESNETIYILIWWYLTMLFQKQWWLLPSLSSTKNKSNAPWKFSIGCHRYLNCTIFFLYTHFEFLLVSLHFRVIYNLFLCHLKSVIRKYQYNIAFYNIPYLSCYITKWTQYVAYITSKIILSI